MSALQNAVKSAIASVMEQMKVRDPELYNAMKDKIQVVLDIGKTEEKKTPPNMIFEMVRERHKRVGVIVGLKQDDIIKVGWAKCNVKLDKFNRDEGIALAEARAIKMTDSPVLPLCMKKQVMSFQNRCIRYFKGAKTMELIKTA